MMKPDCCLSGIELVNKNIMIDNMQNRVRLLDDAILSAWHPSSAKNYRFEQLEFWAPAREKSAYGD